MKKRLILIGCLFFASCSLPVSSPAIETDSVAETPYIDSFAEVEEFEFYRWFYYNQLNSEEQELYNKILETVKAGDKEDVSVPYLSSRSVAKTWMAFIFDNPEFYWLDSLQTTVSFENYVTMIHLQRVGLEEKERVEKEIEKVVIQLSALTDPYSRLEALYSYIAKNTEYQEDVSNQNNIFSIVMDHKGVCAGYAKFFQLICQKLEIPCIYVTGKDDTRTLHAWNQVLVDSTPVWIDPTWADTAYANQDLVDEIAWQYFCVGDTPFFNSHTVIPGRYYAEWDFSQEIVIPSCPTNAYSWYKIHNSLISGSGKDEIRGNVLLALNGQLDLDALRYDFMFQSKDALDIGQNLLLEDKLFYDAFIARTGRRESFSIQYAVDPLSYTLSIFPQSME